MDNILLWDVDGVTKNLTTLDDMSKITNAMISATSPTTTEIHRASSHSEPSWITEGDLIRGISSADGVTTAFVDNNYLGIYLGKCTNNQGNTFYGIQIKNKVADANINIAGGDPPINYNMDFYLGVTLDRDNERAYLMYCWDKYNSGSNNYYRVYIITAMYNGTDLLWETFKNGYQPKITSNGGGATHIAKVTGQLKDLSSNLSDILMVSGGGGGGLLVGETDYSGKEAGGISGSGDNSADQSTGNAFGQGESGTDASGGGGGLYGGYKGTSSKSGGAGSGYIGNSLVSNKKMIGYNVPTSDAEGTKTESVNEASESPISGKPKIGNGFVRIKFLREVTTYNYGFHIDGSNENAISVTYLADAIGKTPAYMDFTNDVFNYGDWANAFFMPKPCILGQDGVIQKYLNPNDYTKDIDGNSVVIDENLTGANVMIEFPKIWIKVESDENDQYSGSVWISDTKLDDSYHDWAYISSDKVHREHTYLPAYNSSNVNNVLRSLSGMAVNKRTNAETDISRAQGNGSRWYTEMLSQIMLVNFLLVLISKSVDSQSVYGEGLSSGGSESIVNGFRTGVHNTKGLFYGTNSGAAATYTNAVKVFGIENWWGLQWRKYAGYICASSTRKIKMCWGQEDGSTVDAYNTTGNNYVTMGSLSGTGNGIISKMKFVSGKGIFSDEYSGSESTYYCDREYYRNNITDYPMRGGSTLDGKGGGMWCEHRAVNKSDTDFGTNSNISYI